MTARTMDALWELYKPYRVKGMRSEVETIRIYETYLKPTLGSKLVSKIKFELLDEMHLARKGTPYQANRLLSLLRPLFNYAQALRWVPPDHNPAKHVRMFPERKRRRHLTPEEAPRLARAIQRWELTSPHVCAYIWLLIFTGARPGELKSARWRDLKANVLTLQSHKTMHRTGTDRIIILPPPAIDKLNLIGRGRPEAKLLNVHNIQFTWESIKKLAGCPDLRIYDLRHTFATYALERGFTLDQIGESLGHTNPATTKIYAEMSARSRHKVALDSSLAILEDMGIQEVDDPFFAEPDDPFA